MMFVNSVCVMDKSFNESKLELFIGRLSLSLGEKLLDQILQKEGFERCPSQMYTAKDGDCGVSAILHLQGSATRRRL